MNIRKLTSLHADQLSPTTRNYPHLRLQYRLPTAGDGQGAARRRGITQAPHWPGPVHCSTIEQYGAEAVRALPSLTLYGSIPTCPRPGVGQVRHDGYGLMRAARSGEDTNPLWQAGIRCLLHAARRSGGNRRLPENCPRTLKWG